MRTPSTWPADHQTAFNGADNPLEQPFPARETDEGDEQDFPLQMRRPELHDRDMKSNVATPESE